MLKKISYLLFAIAGAVVYTTLVHHGAVYTLDPGYIFAKLVNIWSQGVLNNVPKEAISFDLVKIGTIIGAVISYIKWIRPTILSHKTAQLVNKKFDTLLYLNQVMWLSVYSWLMIYASYVLGNFAGVSLSIGLGVALFFYADIYKIFKK